MILEAKNVIRKRMIEQRNRMSIREIDEKSAVITEQLRSLSQYADAQIVAAYMSYRNEVSTDEFVRGCLRNGKRVVIPKVLQAPTCRLELYEIRDMGKDVLPGYKGILEPNISILKAVDPRDIDLAVIPGVAFDYGRHRIGFGAGFYDRLLVQMKPDCLKIGLAYEMQLTKQFKAEKHDIAMDMVITESRII